MAFTENPARAATTQLDGPRDAGVSIVDQDSLSAQALAMVITHFAHVFPEAPKALHGEDLRIPVMEYPLSGDESSIGPLVQQPLLFSQPESLAAEPKITAGQDRSGRSILLDLSTAIAGGPILVLTSTGSELGSCNEYAITFVNQADKKIVLQPYGRVQLGKKTDPERQISKTYRLMIVCMQNTIYIADVYTVDYNLKVARDRAAKKKIEQWAIGNKEQADVRVGAQLHLSQLKQHNRGRKNRKRRHNAEYLLGRPHRKPSRRQRRNQARKANSETS